MTKFYAFYTVADSGEKFYFENGEECAVIVRAETEGEAKMRFLSCVTDEYEKEAEKQITEELPNNSIDYPFPYYVEWNIDLFPNYESKQQCKE